MYLCYLDESGTPHIPDNTSHFVLAGIAVPVWNWKDCEHDIGIVKRKFNIENSEIHAAWILRSLSSQYKITDFGNLGYDQRRYEVQKLRDANRLSLQKSGRSKRYPQARKNYRKTEAYIHLTHDERVTLITQVAQIVAGWGFARLFAECVDKLHFDPVRAPITVDEQAFEQVVSRLETFLQVTESEEAPQNFGLSIHDTNQPVAKRDTELMQHFRQKGSFWTDVNNLIETLLFVDSELTSMLRIADLCS